MIDKKFFAALLIVGSLLLMFAVQAEIKTYTGVGEDYANQFETQEDAKARAKRIAIENAKKHAGVALKTYSRSIDNELVDNEISTITSNSYKIVGDIKYEKILKPLTDRITVIVWRATVDVDVDDAEVKNWFKRTADEKKILINRNLAAAEAFNTDIKTAEDLNKRAAEPLTEVEEFDLRHEVEAANNDFQVNRKMEDGNRLNYEDKPDAAIEQYSEALKIKFVDAVGEYVMNEFEDPRVGKERSKIKSLKAAQEEGIHYIKDYFQRINIKISDDEIAVIAAQTMEVLYIEQKIFTDKDDNAIIRTNVKVKFQDEFIDRYLSPDYKMKQAKLLEKYREIGRSAYD